MGYITQTHPDDEREVMKMVSKKWRDDILEYIDLLNMATDKEHEKVFEDMTIKVGLAFRYIAKLEGVDDES